MNFKKKCITPTTPVKKISWFLMSIIWIFFLSILVYIVFFIFDSFWNKGSYNFYDDIKTNINKQMSKIEQKITSIQSPQKEKYNILLTWVWWANHDWWELTDTIILVGINATKNIVSMLSIPRDLYVEQSEWKNWKINEIYLKNLWKENNISKWMTALWSKIEEITWEKIDYYTSVDFAWFVKIVDLFGWVEVDVPENIYDTEYPNWNLWYTTFSLKKWIWTLDWETALKYARSRHSTSDFDRSLRQQQVLKSLKEKVESQWFFKNAIKIKELYDIFTQYVKTDLDINTIVTLASILWNDDPEKKTKIYSSNLNNSCFYWSPVCEKWWFLYTPDRNIFGWMSVLLPSKSNWRDISKYDDIKKFSDLIFNNPDFLIENYKINIFNSLKWWKYASEVAWNLEKYWFNIPKTNSVWNTNKELYEKSIIYYNDIPDSSETLKVLKKLINIPAERINFPKYSKENDTKIEIIIWNDYLTKDKITKKNETVSWVTDEDSDWKIFNF